MQGSRHVIRDPLDTQCYLSPPQPDTNQRQSPPILPPLPQGGQHGQELEAGRCADCSAILFAPLSRFLRLATKYRYDPLCHYRPHAPDAKYSPSQLRLGPVNNPPAGSACFFIECAVPVFRRDAPQTTARVARYVHLRRQVLLKKMDGMTDNRGPRTATVVCGERYVR